VDADDDDLTLAARIERIAEWNPHLRQAERADLHHAAQRVAERIDALPTHGGRRLPAD
jgi:hypothetical protein